MERKSPLPAFTKCVKNNVLPLRPCRPPRKWRERERLSIVLREVTNLGFRGEVKNKTLTSSTIHPLNITSPSPAFGTLPRGVVVEPFTLHPSRFTLHASPAEKQLSGLFGMSGKRGFPTPYGLVSLSLTLRPPENPLLHWQKC